MSDSEDNDCSDERLPTGYLKLPDAPDFVSKPLEIPLWAQVKLCEEMLPYRNKNRFDSPDDFTTWTVPFFL